ncbi:MAG TPA: hypothetical protein P5556_05905 [Candidatus Gastranaerophilales bacterium]|nr:hypothetical protein [Candidatus Gastranaerophilales bacterium]
MNASQKIYIGFSFFLIGLIGIISLFSCGNIPVSHIFSIKKHCGVVYNLTSEDIYVISDKFVIKIPSKTNSKEMGIYDADGLVINKPIIFNNKTYNNKIFRFCDLGKIKIKENKNKEIYIQPFGMSWTCKLAGKFGMYDSMEEAFNRNPHIKREEEELAPH